MLHPDLTQLMQRFNELVDNVEAGHISYEDAVTTLAQLIVIDGSGAHWSISSDGRWLRAFPGDEPMETDPYLYTPATVIVPPSVNQWGVDDLSQPPQAAFPDHLPQGGQPYPTNPYDQAPWHPAPQDPGPGGNRQGEAYGTSGYNPDPEGIGAVARNRQERMRKAEREKRSGITIPKLKMPNFGRDRTQAVDLKNVPLPNRDDMKYYAQNYGRPVAVMGIIAALVLVGYLNRPKTGEDVPTPTPTVSATETPTPAVVKASGGEMNSIAKALISTKITTASSVVAESAPDKAALWVAFIAGAKQTGLEVKITGNGGSAPTITIIVSRNGAAIRNATLPAVNVGKSWKLKNWPTVL